MEHRGDRVLASLGQAPLHRQDRGAGGWRAGRQAMRNVVRTAEIWCAFGESEGLGVRMSKSREFRFRRVLCSDAECWAKLYICKAMAGAKGGHVMRRMVLVNYLSDVTFRRVILQKALPLHSLHLESKPNKLLRHKTSPQPIGLGGEGINLWFKSPLA